MLTGPSMQRRLQVQCVDEALLNKSSSALLGCTHPDDRLQFAIRPPLLYALDLLLCYVFISEIVSVHWMIKGVKYRSLTCRRHLAVGTARHGGRFASYVLVP